MSTNIQALNLAAHFRRTSFGSCVLIYLEQAPEETDRGS
jgi:hypothetical protein